MKINEEQKQQYQEYVKQVTPTHNLLKEVGKAFLTGGLICVLGQFLQNTGLNIGMDQKTASTWCSILLVLLSVLLTGFNIYPSIAKWALQTESLRLPLNIKKKDRSSVLVLKSLQSQVLSSSMESLPPGSLA